MPDTSKVKNEKFSIGKMLLVLPFSIPMALSNGWCLFGMIHGLYGGSTLAIILAIVAALTTTILNFVLFSTDIPGTIANIQGNMNVRNGWKLFLASLLALGAAGGPAVFTMKMVFTDTILSQLPPVFNWAIIILSALSLFFLTLASVYKLGNDMFGGQTKVTDSKEPTGVKPSWRKTIISIISGVVFVAATIAFEYAFYVSGVTYFGQPYMGLVLGIVILGGLGELCNSISRSDVPFNVFTGLRAYKNKNWKFWVGVCVVGLLVTINGVANSLMGALPSGAPFAIEIIAIGCLFCLSSVFNVKAMFELLTGKSAADQKRNRSFRHFASSMGLQGLAILTTVVWFVIEPMMITQFGLDGMMLNEIGYTLVGFCFLLSLALYFTNSNIDGLSNVDVRGEDRASSNGANAVDDQPVRKKACQACSMCEKFSSALNKD